MKNLFRKNHSMMVGEHYLSIACEIARQHNIEIIGINKKDPSELRYDVRGTYYVIRIKVTRQEWEDFRYDYLKATGQI